MKDPVNMMNAKRPSNFYVSNNYGKHFVNRTKEFKLHNGTVATISDFFASKADRTKYILVAKFHKVIFVSNDDCKTFKNFSVPFFPNEMKYHPRYQYYVLGHENHMGNQRVSILSDLFLTSGKFFIIHIHILKTTTLT